MSNRLQSLPSDLLVSKIFNVKNLSACHINDTVKSLNLKLTEDDYFHLIKTHFDEDFLLDFEVDFGLIGTFEERFQILTESHCVILVFKFYLYHANTDTIIRRGRFFKRNLNQILKWYYESWKSFSSHYELQGYHNYANSYNKQTLLLVSAKGDEIWDSESFANPDPDGMGLLEIDGELYDVVGEVKKEKNFYHGETEQD